MKEIFDRIEKLNKMCDNEPNPIIRDYYRNVIRQLQIKLEQM